MREHRLLSSNLENLTTLATPQKTSDYDNQEAITIKYPSTDLSQLIKLPTGPHLLLAETLRQ